MTARTHLVCGIVATIVVGGAIAWGFVLAGSPTTRRLERFDEQRLRDLHTIAREIQRLVEDPKDKRILIAPLPKTLDEAATRAREQRINLHDPETGEPYGYTVTDETTYELCATFSLPRSSDASIFWNHAVGPTCFSIDVRTPPPLY